MDKEVSRKEQAQLTKQKIFDTAVALIKQHGYNQVTVSQICREAGIAKGSFYVHYDAKEDIVRESYYSDMNDYIHAHYAQYLQQNPTASTTQKIIAFLGLELAFAEYTGYELTCLAFAVNLSACLPGPSPHFTKRRFSKTLYSLLEETKETLPADFTIEEAFTYLESMVRGIMATWCFSGGAYRLASDGKKAIARSVAALLAAPNH